MASPSSYVPKTALARWLDARLPVIRLVHDQFIVFPTPNNLNVWWVFGAILVFLLAVQIVTGIVLAMHYVPTSAGAFDSVERHIMREVRYGWLIRSVHATGASMMFVALYLHMARGIYYGSYKAPREVLWILGVVIYLLLMATAFFGYTLQWGQMSYWAATVITSLFAAFDQLGTHLGSALSNWVRGDYAVGDATLGRFFSLHYLLPFVVVGLATLHVWALHAVGNNNPTGVAVKSAADTVPFHPRYTVKDGFFLVLFVAVLLGFVFYAPDFFANPDNAAPANPLVTPAEIKPEWYLLPYYAMLRAVPNMVVGVLVLFGALLTPLFLPWLDASKVRSCRYRPLMRQLFWLLVADCLLLGIVGAESIDAAWRIGEFRMPLVWLARLGTGYYFAFFWVLMPWIGRIEVTRPVPESLSQSVPAGGGQS